MIGSKALGFIGGGNMGEALLKGLLGSGLLETGQIRVSDISQDRRQHLQSVYQVLTVTDNAELARSSQIIVLAVKPQQVDGVLAEIKPSLAHQPLLISVAAGVRLSHLEEAVGQSVPVVRVMPNTPALVLAGISAMAAGAHAGTEHLATTRVLFQSVGRVLEVSEPTMDAVTGLSGSGPAYVLLFMEALIDAGVLVGLTRAQARDLVVQTTLGTAKLVAESNEHPSTLKDQITSPGGTTIHGLAVLERGGVRGLLMDAVAAATRKSKDLGKK